MARTLIGDVSNGKGSRKRIGADDNKYADGWDRIFGNKDKKEESKEDDSLDKDED